MPLQTPAAAASANSTQPSIPGLGFEAGVNPFPDTRHVVGESVVFITAGEDQPSSASLLFIPERVTRVYRPFTGEVYEEGRDYTIDAAEGRLLRPAGSRIPAETLERAYPAAEAPNAIGEHISGKSWMYLTAGEILKIQVEVDYVRAEAAEAGELAHGWPASQLAQLPRLAARMRDGGALRLVVLGDSISVGGDVSSLGKHRPFLPSYSILLTGWLERSFGLQVEYHNLAVGGMKSDWGAQQTERAAALKPELMIVAFGMNDASLRMEPAEYLANIRTILEGVRAENPQCEFILVSTMVANPEWSYSAPDYYHAFRKGLLTLAGPGVIVADMTTIWEGLLQRKKYLDITGNGVNHPNDFGHRVYAWALAALMAP